MKKSKYRIGDTVLVKSPAGDAIPKIHVKLLRRIVVDPTPGKRVGFKTTMDWPGYAGWEATPVFQSEIDALRRDWCIPLVKANVDVTFVYDECIVRKPRSPVASPAPGRKGHRKKGKRTILRKKK
jgi:hypothetical protein